MSSVQDKLSEAAMNFLSVLDRIDRAYLRGSPLALAALGTTSAYYVAFSYGAGVTYLLLGREKTTRLFSNSASHPAVILLGIPLIPVLLVSLESYDLEGRLVTFWRRAISPRIKTFPLFGPVLDSVMEWLWPSPTREPHISTQDGLTGTIDHLARNVSAGLSLPFIAYTLSLAFKSVSQDHTRRVLLGGLTFFSIKTFVMAYLRQQEYRRQGSRTVLNFDQQKGHD